MKRYIVAGLIMIGIALHSTVPVSGQQQSVFLWGYVKWSTGTGAEALEVRLLAADNVVSRVYTNQSGRFLFQDVPGTPSQYSLQVRLGPKVLAERNRGYLTQFQRGAQLPDIVL